MAAQASHNGPSPGETSVLGQPAPQATGSVITPRGCALIAALRRRRRLGSKPCSPRIEVEGGIALLRSFEQALVPDRVTGRGPAEEGQLAGRRALDEDGPLRPGRPALLGVVADPFDLGVLEGDSHHNAGPGARAERRTAVVRVRPVGQIGTSDSRSRSLGGIDLGITPGHENAVGVVDLFGLPY